MNAAFSTGARGDDRGPDSIARADDATTQATTRSSALATPFGSPRAAMLSLFVAGGASFALALFARSRWARGAALTAGAAMFVMLGRTSRALVAPSTSPE